MGGVGFQDLEVFASESGVGAGPGRVSRGEQLLELRGFPGPPDELALQDRDRREAALTSLRSDSTRSDRTPPL